MMGTPIKEWQRGGVASDLAEALSEELSDEYKLVFDVILLNRN